MSRNPFEWPFFKNITVTDSSGNQYSVEVRKRPGSTGFNADGSNWFVESAVCAFFLDGTPIEADRENEGVFFSISSNEVYRKV